MDKLAEEMDDLITRYVILLRFTTSQKKITDLLTDFMLRVTELKFEAKLKEEHQKSIQLIGEVIDNYEADAINLPAEFYNELKYHWKKFK